MNGVSLSTSVSYVAPQGVEDTQSTNRSPNTATLTVSIAGAGGQGSTPLSFQLTYPLVDMSDIPINELTQQLQSLGLEGFQLTATANAALQMLGAVHSYASGIVAGGAQAAAENAESIAMTFGTIEQVFGNLEQSISKMLDSGDYPDYASFLKLMLRTSQEIKEMASNARQAAVKGEFENIMSQADMMRTAATKRHDAAMEEIEAARAEATSKIISGSIGIVTSVAGFAGAGAGNRTQGVQAGAGVGGSISSISDGITGHITADMRERAEGMKKDADMLDAGRKEMEAAQKLLQESQDVAKELGDIAKQLRDMVMNMYKDFIANQSQIIQRANI